MKANADLKTAMTINPSEKATRDSEIIQTLTGFEGYIKYFAYKYIGDRGLVEDIVQEVYIKALRNKWMLSVCTDQLKRWLATTTVRAAIDCKRTLARRSRLEYPSCDYSDDALSSAVVRESHDWADPFTLKTIDSFLTELSEPHREVLVLWARGYSMKQISMITSTKLGTVRSRLHYARSKARAALRHLL